jgi:hypothetical protein
MTFKHFSFGAGLLALALATAFSVPAGAADDPHAEAVKACSAFGHDQTATLVTAIDDGRGGTLVWLSNDSYGLWLCSADSAGHVYAYSTIQDDMLQGAGANLLDGDQVASNGDVPLPSSNPIDIAARACQAYHSGEATNVIGSGQDGLGDDWIPGYYVFLQTGAGNVYLCDATADAQVWAFVEIGNPITSGNQVG